MATSETNLAQSVRRGPLERVLSVFSSVKPGEGGTVLLLALSAFNMMALYYILTPIREASSSSISWFSFCLA